MARGNAGSGAGEGGPTSSGRSALRVPEVRGHRRLSLMRDIAVGEKSDPQMCRTYGLTARELMAFTAEYADEIADIGQAIHAAGDVAMAGLWITRRQSRLAEIQADIEDINDTIEEFRADGGKLITQFSMSKSYQSLLRTKLNALREAAVQIDGPRRNEDPEDKNVVHYVLEADDFTGNLT